nr:dienelactone hydrolase family protein [Actinomycetospora sp. NBRC 106375]
MFRPARQTSGLGVLVVHGGAGRDEHADDRARRLAALGHVAFACDLFGERIAGDRERILREIAALTNDPDRAGRRAGAALEVLAAQSGVERLAAVGYCLGGTIVLGLARAGVSDLGAVASIHGGLRTTTPATPGSVRARVLVSHGGADPYVPAEDVTAFTAEMLDAAADWQLLVHAGAQHGFTHTHADRHPHPGVAYHAEADAHASAALAAFLAADR